ncbi:hypothetical protein DIPPA_03330 [Diplonema papillatum]|nr:hypothetical protein DIPPA_03330 [Diplonema papillatum]
MGFLIEESIEVLNNDTEGSDSGHGDAQDASESRGAEAQQKEAKGPEKRVHFSSGGPQVLDAVDGRQSGETDRAAVAPAPPGAEDGAVGARASPSSAAQHPCEWLASPGTSCCSPSAESSVSPLMSPGSGADEFAQMLGELQCPICLSSYQEPVSLFCGHTLCKDHVFELAAMFNHPDTGLLEFDCPKCRQRCSFKSKQDVKVNFEMKNMITLVLKAAQKSSAQRRSEREKRLLAQLKKYEEQTVALREKGHKLEMDKLALAEQQKKLKAHASDTLSAKQAADEADRLAREREQLQRERLRVQRQKDDVNKQAQLVLRERAMAGKPGAAGPGGGAWSGMTPDEKRAEIQRLKAEADHEKEQQRLERDRLIQHACDDWVRKADDTRQRVFEERLQDHSRGAHSSEDRGPSLSRKESSSKFSRMKQLPDRSDAAAASRGEGHPTESPGLGQRKSVHFSSSTVAREAVEQPATPAFPHLDASAYPHHPSPPTRVTDTPVTAFSAPHEEARGGGLDANGERATDRYRAGRAGSSQGVGVPQAGGDGAAPAAVSRTESILSFARAVNPITGFPDPQHIEEIDGGGDFRFEADVFARAVLEVPPTKAPEDYPNYHFSLTDGIDYELHDVLGKVDRKYTKVVQKAHDRAVLARKAQIAEQRAMAMVAQVRNREKQKVLKPAYKPKLAKKTHSVAG